jgi:HEAT repeat protein
MAVSKELKTLVDQMPDPDERGMYTQNIDKEKIDKAIAEIAEGGRESVAGLIEMLGEPGSPENAKPRYALHCLANHNLVVRDEKARKQLAETLAEALSDDRPGHIKAFLCQELQWAGRKEAVVALGQLLLDEELVEPASMALVAIKDGAAEQFRAALPKAEGKCRLNIVQGLGAVEDEASVVTLRKALADADVDVRVTAGWGLSRMGDAGAVDAIIKAADAEPGWERSQATKHCLVLAEKLATAGNAEQSAKLYNYLIETRTDPAEAYVREAAQKGLGVDKESLV